MNTLTISTRVEKHHADLSTCELVASILNVVVIFKHQKNGSRSHRSIVVEMSARLRGHDLDALKCELLQSATSSVECEVWADENTGDPGDEWTIQTIDPDGVLKWLGIDFETFKQYQKNDQPVRLPAPGVR